MELTFAERLGKLSVYEKEYLRYTRCLCRGVELLVSNEPEELVRQVLLDYLINESGLYPTKIDIKAEHNNLDVAIFLRVSDEHFRPFQPPIVIIEVKREGANLFEHVGQLHNYLRENRTNAGILFNGSEVIAFENYLSEDPVRNDYHTFNDIGEVVRRATDQGNSPMDLFRRAQDGAVDGFISIVNKYGRYALHKITFALKDSPTPIAGCCFTVKDQTIYYEIYGTDSRKNKFSFQMNEFNKLISVIYGS
jgi:hypothetical protein